MTAADAESPEGGLVAGKYLLLRRIGEGGMGVVHEAEHTITGRRVAIKMMHARHGWSGEAVERFVREARIAARIGHPNILEVLDAGTHDDGRPFMALPLLKGESLAALLAREGALPARDALAIVEEVLDGLEAAHEIGVVHRDIKPENVFVCVGRKGQREIKLLDFGISKIADDGGRDSGTLTKTGAVLGTASFMSPEQIRGEAVDARTDLWSVGVMLYRMLAGVLPFEASNFNTTIVRVMTDDPIALGEVAPGLPPELCTLVTRALRKDRAARPGSASELLAEVRRISGSGHPGLEGPPPSTPPKVTRPSTAPTEAQPGLRAPESATLAEPVAVAAAAPERASSPAQRTPGPSRTPGPDRRAGDPAPSRSRTVLEVRHCDEVCAIAVYGPVMLTYWRGAPTVAALDRVAAVQTHWFARMGENLGAVTILDSEAGLSLGPEERERAAAMQRAARPHLVAIATVVGAQGFTGAVVRGVLTSVSLLSGSRATERSFQATADATAWLTGVLASRGRTITGAEVERAIEDLVRRARGGGRP